MSVRPIARSLAVSRTLTGEEVAKVSGADSAIEVGDSTICNDPESFTRPDPPRAFRISPRCGTVPDPAPPIRSIERRLVNSRLFCLGSKLPSALGRQWARDGAGLHDGPSPEGRRRPRRYGFGGHAARVGLTVRYYRTHQLLEDMAIAHQDGSVTRVRTALARFDLLILDDFGLAPLTELGKHDLLDIVGARTRSASILLASSRSRNGTPTSTIRWSPTPFSTGWSIPVTGSNWPGSRCGDWPCPRLDDPRSLRRPAGVAGRPAAESATDQPVRHRAPSLMAPFNEGLTADRHHCGSNLWRGRHRNRLRSDSAASPCPSA